MREVAEIKQRIVYVTIRMSSPRIVTYLGAGKLLFRLVDQWNKTWWNYLICSNTLNWFYFNFLYIRSMIKLKWWIRTVCNSLVCRWLHIIWGTLSAMTEELRKVVLFPCYNILEETRTFEWLRVSNLLCNSVIVFMRGPNWCTWDLIW